MLPVEAGPGGALCSWPRCCIRRRSSAKRCCSIAGGGDQGRPTGSGSATWPGCLATSPESAVRNGTDAVRFAETGLSPDGLSTAADGGRAGRRLIRGGTIPRTRWGAERRRAIIWRAPGAMPGSQAHERATAKALPRRANRYHMPPANCFPPGNGVAQSEGGYWLETQPALPSPWGRLDGDMLR